MRVAKQGDYSKIPLLYTLQTDVRRCDDIVEIENAVKYMRSKGNHYYM